MMERSQRWVGIAAILCGIAGCGGGGAASGAPASETPPSTPAAPAPATPVAQAFALLDAGDGSTAFETYLSMSTADGIAVRTSWQALEPARGSYDWALLDTAVSAATRHGKKLGLHVIASGYAPPPGWLLQQGTQTYSYKSPAGTLVTDPVPWDASFLSEWARFLAALQLHLQATGGMDRLAYLSVAVPAPEMSLPGCANAVLGSGPVAYDRAKYRDAWMSAIHAAHLAFPRVTKLLPVPVATICRPDADGPALYLELLNEAVAAESVGFAFYATDLTAKGSARMDGVMTGRGRAPVVLQFTGAASAAAGQSLQGSLKNAVCAGLRVYGASLLEVYKADLSSPDPAVQSGIAAIRAPQSCP